MAENTTPRTGVNAPSFELARVIRTQVSTIPEALRALDVMGQQLAKAKTFEEIKKLDHYAEALKILFAHVDEVKHKAEDIILAAHRRIGEELKKIPKASGGRRVKSDGRVTFASGKGASGKDATGVSRKARSREQQFASIPGKQVERLRDKLRSQNRDATVNAVLEEFAKVKAAAEREARRAEYAARIEHGQTVDDLHKLIASNQHFGVICADPPWTFETYSGKGKQRSAEQHYDCMSLDGIKALPIRELSADVLLLWAVGPHLPQALELIEAWGFKFKTIGFVLVKAEPGADCVCADGKGLHLGMGYHTRSNAEPCLLASRATPERLDKGVHQVIVAPVGEHSAKPDEAFKRIERLYPGPYLELFARRPREGWTVWGNEIPAAEPGEPDLPGNPSTKPKVSAP
jgi:N6-adenosine-specific RNA methylase IME4